MLHNLKPAKGATSGTKRVGRGQGSGMGKTATKGHKGQKARTGAKKKRNFEGGQQPLAKRLPKIGFTSKIAKPYAINVDRVKKVAELGEITIDTIKTVHKISASVTKIKLIGKGASALSEKVKDENITISGKQ